MKNLAITIFVLLVVIILGLYLFLFQVRETEAALLMTFGEATSESEITDPGWYFKWPAPIQRVYKFDSRMRVFEPELGETPTKGVVPIIVNTYVVWRIAEPLEFFNSVKTVKKAEDLLRSQINDTQNNVIGQYNFSDFVNSDKSRIKIEEIQSRMLTDLRQAVRDNYGIEIRTLGIKQLKVSQDVSKDVFVRMRTERNRKTEATIAEGNAEATKIKTDAESKKIELLAAAEARAKAIRGQGDAEAAKYYKMLEADRELAMFLRDVESLKKILEKRSTIVLSADTEPFKLLREMPNIEPQK
ncbi:MAG: protease modulator HflC [Planctomycetota bacterium]|jgi:membrane protease subunit HflC